MSVVTITPPTVEPVTLSEVKEWCRVEDLDLSQDATLAMLITAARERAEHITGRAFIQRTVEQHSDKFPGFRAGWGYCIPLELSPALSITSVKYLDNDGVQQTLAPSGYFLDESAVPSILWPTYATSWPAGRCTANSVRVRYVAGYAGSTDSPSDLRSTMPASLKLWMQTRIVTRFNAREDVIPGSVTILPDKYVDNILDDLILGTRFA